MTSATWGPLVVVVPLLLARAAAVAARVDALYRELMESRERHDG